MNGEEETFEYESEKDMLKYFNLWFVSESEALYFTYGWSVWDEGENKGEIWKVTPHVETISYDPTTFGTDVPFKEEIGDGEYIEGVSNISTSDDKLTLTLTLTGTVDGETYVNSRTYKYNANPQFYGATTAWTGPADYGYDPHDEWPYIFGNGFKEGDLILISISKASGTANDNWGLFITSCDWPKDDYLQGGAWAGAGCIWTGGFACSEFFSDEETIVYRMTAKDAQKVNAVGGFVIC